MAAAQEENFDWNFKTDAAVGIDLGTTYSCIAVYTDSRVTVIPDEDGKKLVPSVVGFVYNAGGMKRLVGRHDATENEGIGYDHVVTEVKRLIGRKFDEEAVQTNMKRWPHSVTANKNGNAQVSMHFYGHSPLHLSPEDISSSILAKLKKMAENHLGKEVTEAVITVPTHFNNSQRKATIKAAELAKLKVQAIINEPNAGALAYGIKSKVRQKRIILVMDVGGGTSDAALTKVVGEKFTVLSCKGDNNLGGEDFNTNIVNYCVEQIKQEFGSYVMIEKQDQCRLRSQCKTAKHKLSENPDDPFWQYVLELDSFTDEDLDITIPISRSKFEELNQNLFNKAIGLVTSCLNEAKLSIFDVNDLVPVGGSMRIPKLREMLQDQFEGRQLYAYINPDEAVAVGAAIFAAQKLALYRGHIVVSDITPFSLGIKGIKSRGEIKEKGVMCVIIPLNTKIPCKGQDRFSTNVDNQTVMQIDVYQGENEYVKDNMFLGSFEIENLTPALAEKTKVDVTLEVDTNGILKVTAREVEAVDDNVVTGKLDTLLPNLNMLNVTELE